MVRQRPVHSTTWELEEPRIVAPSTPSRASRHEFLRTAHGRRRGRRRDDKLLAFSLGCFFAGVAGAFYAHFIRFLFPPEFGFLLATNIPIYNFVGGRGHVAGPIVGAAFLSLLSEPFRGSPYETIFFSIVMLLTILFLPGGLVTLPGKLAGLRWRKSVSTSSPRTAA